MLRRGRAANMLFMSKPGKKMKFEEALRRLDEIVAAMEAGEIGIEESIEQYEEAMRIAKHCREVLDQAELRIRQIRADAGGEMTATELPAKAAADED